MSTPLNTVILCSCGVIIKTEEEKVEHQPHLYPKAPPAKPEPLFGEGVVIMGDGTDEPQSFSSTPPSNEHSEKVPCPTCGRAMNRYKITLKRHMVVSMRKVYMWCGEKRVHEFQRKDIRHLLVSENETAHFGDLVYFGGILYKKRRGFWGMNMKRARAFLHGESQINTSAWKDPFTKKVELSDPRFISEVKDMKDLLTEDFMFVPEYENL